MSTGSAPPSPSGQGHQVPCHADGGAGGEIHSSDDIYLGDDAARAAQLGAAAALLARMETLAAGQGGGAPGPTSPAAAPPPGGGTAAHQAPYTKPSPEPPSTPSSFLWQGGTASMDAPLDKVLDDEVLLHARTAFDIQQWFHSAASAAKGPLAALQEQLHALKAVSDSGESTVQEAIAGAIGQLSEELKEWGIAEKEHYESLQAWVTAFRRSLRRARSGGGGMESSGASGLPTDDECTAWLAAAGSTTCVDDDVVDHFTDDLLAARDRCLLALQAAQTRWEGVCERLGIQSEDECGGWSQSDHATFTAILRRQADRATAKRGAQASTRAATTQALAKQLPNKSPQAVERHMEWSEQRSSRRKHCKDAKQAFEREAQQLVAEGKRSFAAANDAAQQQQARRLELEAVSTEADAKRAKLRKLQRKAARKAAAQAEEDSAAALRQAEAAAAAAAQAELHAAQQRRAVQEWQHAQSRSAAAAAANEAAHAEASAAARAAQVADAAPRVQARADALEAKRAAAALAAQQALDEEQALAERLAAIKQQASYADAVGNVQRDTARLQSHTTASHYAAEMGTAHAAYIQATSAAYQRQRDAADAAVDAQEDGAPVTGIGANNETMAAARQGRLTKRMAEWRAAEKGHFASEREGLSDARVFSDVRSKLVYALHAAGLTGSDYAGRVLRDAARPVPRAMATQHNFQ